MRKILAVAILIVAAVRVHAQSFGTGQIPLQPFTDWLKQQKAYAGVGWSLDQHNKAKYVTSAWDLVQFGKAGLNVAKPSADYDYIDLSPMWAIANGKAPRYGSCVSVHGGNLWNNIHLSPSIDSHINRTKLPPIVIAWCPLYPNDHGVNLPLSKMQPFKRDGMVELVWGFGGS